MTMWEYYSNSRLKDQCMYRLHLKYNKSASSTTGFYAVRGLVVEAGCIAKRYGNDIVEEMQAKLGVLMDENPELIWERDKINYDFDSWVAGVLTYNPIERQVVGDQIEVNVKLKTTSRHINGYIDLLEIDDQGKYVISDIKCKGSLTKTIPKDWVWAATIYSVGIRQQYNLDYFPQGEIHMISVGKKPGFHCLQVPIGIQEMNEIVERVEIFDKYLELGWFPRNRAADSCNDRVCDYYSQCHGETYDPDVMELFE